MNNTARKLVRVSLALALFLFGVIAVQHSVLVHSAPAVLLADDGAKPAGGGG